MKDKFENTNETNTSNSREAISIVTLIVFVVLMLALATRELILSDFGVVLANLSLGVFGFSSYAIYSFAIIISIVTLFTKKSKNSGLIIFSIALMIFSGLVALQIWTANAGNILVDELSFTEFVNQSYNLECIGLYGSSAGGALFSSMIYFPVKFLKVVGTYWIAGLIFAVAIFGLIVGIKKKLSLSNNNSNKKYYSNNNKSQQIPQMPIDANGVNAVKMGFAPNINDLRSKQIANDANFQGHNFFDNMGQHAVNNGNAQVAQPPQTPSAYEMLYPQNSQNQVPKTNVQEEADGIEEYENMKGTRKNAKLFVSNVGKNSSLNQKTKREIHVEEKEKKRAQDILFTADDGTDFTIDNSNRPKNLANDRKVFDKRVDFLRDDTVLPTTFNNNLGTGTRVPFPSFDDTHKNIDLINKPQIKANENLKYDFKSTDEDFSVKRKSFFDEPKDKQLEQKPTINPSVPLQDTPTKSVKANKDEVADLYRIGKANNEAKIINASNFVKKDELSNKKEEIVEDKQEVVEGIKKITEPKVSESKYYTKEDYINNTKEIKDLFASGKIKDREIEIPNSNVGFDKKLPNNLNSIKIIKSVDEISPSEKRKKEEFDVLSKAILNAPVDEVFNQIELDQDVDLTVLKADKVVDVNRGYSAPIYSLDDFEKQQTKVSVEENSDSTKTRSVFYPLNSVKEIKVANGEKATQLPIIAKETKTISENKPIARVPYQYPPIDLLKMGKSDIKTISEETEQKSRILENILKSFSINSKVVETVIGPVITRYELEIQQGIQVKRVEQISKDITMGLESPCEVIIQAPIPGKNRLGIEVPNKTKELVRLRDVIETDDFVNAKSKISYALGKEVDGKNVICDITKMPHLLIAGSTGTGKSVCLNTILVSLLYKTTPEEMRLILIDPKRVEFTAYRDLPHLLIDEIICDSEKAISALAWAIDEMERRFILFQSTMTKDLDSYNGKLDLTTTKKLPRIVIIVDELADLLTLNKKELEEKITRLAQKSRAAGIHLILATQRPSVDVITGVIKTNLPSRISFKLSNGIDSKTVLDETGSEKLLGNGDMFYKPVFENTKVRVQGCYVSGKEVEEVVEYVKTHNQSEYDETIKNSIIFEKKKEEETNANDEEIQLDDKFVDAVRLAIENSQISISMIQRRYSVGYNRAGKILDAMEKMGYVSSFNGSKPREVYITKEQFEKDFGEF